VNTKAVLLVGGMGTRLREVVPSLPKPLARVGNRPFLELLIRQLLSQGIDRLVMCTGYLADQIEREFGDGREFGATIEYSVEPEPLGTAGAIKLAQGYLQTVPDFLVMNGDSFLDIDLRQFVHFHRTHGGLATLAVVPVENAGRYGTVFADSSNRVSSFFEKTGKDSPGLINAGVYAFNRDLFQHISDGPVSLEKNVFPQLLGRGVYAMKQQGLFIDIGTPTDYIRAQQLFDRMREATNQGQSS
jgi:NDP-sugar pyrophosphorylase family protein